MTFETAKKLFEIKASKFPKLKKYKFELMKDVTGDGKRVYRMRRWAQCDTQYKIISISPGYLRLIGSSKSSFDLLHLRDTILHEIAHAIRGNRKGNPHNKKWRVIAKSIGCQDVDRYDRYLKMKTL